MRTPRISYTNWGDAPGTYRRWPTLKRYWAGRLIYIQWRGHQINLDFRGDWLDELRG